MGWDVLELDSSVLTSWLRHVVYVSSASYITSLSLNSLIIIGITASALGEDREWLPQCRAHRKCPINVVPSWE